ncbi:MAG: LamG domain-containing protein, partial [Planctomycetota bacterium]|nr:LamG domain-containing protein [Planctomycetota bacterium]
MLFLDQIADRGFDVSVGGTKIVSSFFPGAVQGGGQERKKGAVITHQFVATSTSLSVTLDGSAVTTARDKNPILNGFTLEDLGARSPILGTVKTYNSGKGVQIGGPAGQQTLDVALNTDAWNHVAQTFDGSQLLLYVNGVLVQSTPAAADLKFVEPTQIALGSQPGALDELRVWNVARTQAEIQKSMYTALEGTEKGLQGYWPFDGDLKDKSTRSADFVKSSGTASFFNNPQPQVGSVDVIVDQPVNSAVGLFVGYTITGG